MTRVKGGAHPHLRHKKVLKLAKGKRGAYHRLFKRANEAMLHSLWYAYRDRRNRKRDLRRLWIARINAAARQNGVAYNTFIHGLKAAGVEVNRKMLSEIAIHDAAAFTKLVEVARGALAPA